MILIPFIKFDAFKAARTEDWQEITEEEFHALNARAGADDPEAQLALGYFYIDQAEKKLEMLRSIPSGNGYLKGISGIWDRNPISDDAEQDRRTAFGWFQKAAEQGCADAVYQLSTCYLRGEGTPLFFKKGVELLEKAACMGHIQAQYDWGMLYRYGKKNDSGAVVEFPKDEALAVEWLHKAAEKDDKLAQYQLALCYEESVGGTKDFKKAFYWYRRAAEGEYPLTWAFFKLAEFYEKGMGVARNIREAIAWYQKAAEQGDEEAYEALDRLNGEE